jgi:hypothetical protein
LQWLPEKRLGPAKCHLHECKPNIRVLELAIDERIVINKDLAVNKIKAMDLGSKSPLTLYRNIKHSFGEVLVSRLSKALKDCQVLLSVTFYGGSSVSIQELYQRCSAV